MTGGNIFINYN